MKTKLSCNKPLDATPVIFARRDRGWETWQDIKSWVLFLLSVVIKKKKKKKKNSLGKKNVAYKVRVSRSVVSKFINGALLVSYS